MGEQNYLLSTLAECVDDNDDVGVRVYVATGAVEGLVNDRSVTVIAV